MIDGVGLLLLVNKRDVAWISQTGGILSVSREVRYDSSVDCRVIVDRGDLRAVPVEQLSSRLSGGGGIVRRYDAAPFSVAVGERLSFWGIMRMSNADLVVRTDEPGIVRAHYCLPDNRLVIYLAAAEVVIKKP